VPSVIVRDLSSDAVGRMLRADLAHATEEPPSAVDTFDFHGCGCGVGAFVGRPPWERHNGGDELLLVLSGSSRLTVLLPEGPVSDTLYTGTLAVVPAGTWHNNDAPDGVTMLYMTPLEGNEHSWEDPTVGSR
jgi:mannose-6-phosphate isomerase-like protein (cupin superfamily)